jgi:hypothetical protein
MDVIMEEKCVFFKHGGISDELMMFFLDELR